MANALLQIDRAFFRCVGKNAVTLAMKSPDRQDTFRARKSDASDAVGLSLTSDSVASYPKYSIWLMASRASVGDSRQTASQRNLACLCG
jgi:hypothetical protein